MITIFNMNLFLLTSIVAIGLAIFDLLRLKKYLIDTSDPIVEKMSHISDLIRVGGYSCMNSQYIYLIYIIPFLYTALYYFYNIYAANGLILGASISLACLYYALEVSVSGNILTAIRSMAKLKSGFKQAYMCGRSTGSFIIGTCLLGIAIINFISNSANRFSLMLGTTLGASIISIFARLGGGVFTKAADIGADLVGKVFHDIPEDSPENPGVIADNIGDNIGDCVGTTADIVETYMCGFMAAFMFLKGTQFTIITLSSTLGSLIGINLVRNLMFPNDNEYDSRSITYTMGLTVFASIFASTALFIGMTYGTAVMGNLVPNSTKLVIKFTSVLLPFIIGILFIPLVLGIAMYYTGKEYGPVQRIADASKSGPSMNIIIGYAISLQASFVTLVSILGMALISWWFGGLAGLSATIITSLGLASTIMTMDAYGPIVDNAGGIVTMSGADEIARDNTDILDSIGNLTKAVTKSYASGITVLGSVLLIQIYGHIVKSGDIFGLSITNAQVILSAVLGGVIPFAFGGLVIQSVYRAANYMLKSISHTINSCTIDDPEYYTNPISALTRKASKYMIGPVLSILLPFLLIFVLRYFNFINIQGIINSIGGLILGSMVSGLPLSISMTIGGAAWDNAKKLIESKVKPRLTNAKAKIESAIASINGDIHSRELDSSKSADYNKLRSKVADLISLVDSAQKIPADQKHLTIDNLLQSISAKVNELNSATTHLRESMDEKSEIEFDIRTCLQLLNDPVKGDLNQIIMNNKILTVFNEQGHYNKIKALKDAGVIGDTLGDPLKDAAGTSLNAMVKMIAILSLVLVSILVKN